MPFSEVVGHRRLVGLLARSVSRDSLPPSLIFAGPQGIGKHLVAVATAQVLNCTQVVTRADGAAMGLEMDACGTCASCTRIARGVHADVVVVGPGEGGTIKIEVVRDLVERAGYRPFEGRRRVVIIDEADALGPQAQNGLLKLLEEPPPSSVFILVTARPDVLLPTVRSRCPRLQFRPLDPDEIAAALVARGYSDVDARAVAAIADGSLGRALAERGGDRAEARAVAVGVLEAAAMAPDPRGRLEAAKTLLGKREGAGRDRDEVALNLRAMASLLRDAEVVSVGARSAGLANPDVDADLESLARAYGGERGLRAFAAIDRALDALERNANAKIVVDWLALQL